MLGPTRGVLYGHLRLALSGAALSSGHSTAEIGEMPSAAEKHG